MAILGAVQGAFGRRKKPGVPISAPGPSDAATIATPAAAPGVPPAPVARGVAAGIQGKAKKAKKSVLTTPAGETTAPLRQPTVLGPTQARY